ncbi:MAG: hypothetical protein VKI42_10255 [Synechococcaceae cyanobacterium]|nr:hypothetical protein [Synechococcaceae cyanobacterium]
MLEVDGVVEDGDVVMAREQGGQAKHEAAAGLDQTETLEVEVPEALKSG